MPLKRQIKKAGWFVGRTYRHFDSPLNFEKAQKFLNKYKTDGIYAFRPFLSYFKEERRFRGFTEDGKALVKHKKRLICYAAHHDAQLYSYYAFELGELYKNLRKTLGIDDCVLAYRADKGCNIHMANVAFEEIKKYENSSVIALDITGFFDNLNHKILKNQWARVLGCTLLPRDHYKLFQSITKFSRVDISECLRALGLQEKQLKKSSAPLTTDQEFRDKISGRKSGYENLIILNSSEIKKFKSAPLWNNFGIPQGSPISAMLSNIYMIDFDLCMNGLLEDVGGKYWRYSDDILIVCPQDKEGVIEQAAYEKIKEFHLEINSSKTEIARFKRILHSEFECSVRQKDGSWKNGVIQYLGFNFDGHKKMLRSGTMSRFARKRKYAVRAARRDAEYFKKKKIRSKKLFRDLTDIGTQSMPSYARRAAKIMKDNTLKNQIKGNREKLKNMIIEANLKYKEGRKPIQKRKQAV
jgi:RNA-directed DNA polymerase